MAIGQGHQVDTDIVATGSSQAATLAADAQSTVSTMLGRLEAVIYKGHGADAYHGACDRMSQDLTRINNGLRWLSEKLGQAGVDYDTADTTSAQQVNSATANVGGIGTALRSA
jgi:uncharacterized protein YukE